MKFTDRFYSRGMKICFLVTLTIATLLITITMKDSYSKELSGFKANSKTVTATLADSSRQISADLMCFNVNTTLVKSWSDDQFLAAVEQLNPKLLRLPGGTVASYWDWRKGGVIDDISSLPEGLPRFLRFKARNYTAGKLPEFKTGLEATNSTPIFVLNLLTSDLKSQIEMLKDARDLGMPVKYIELGNELYFNIKNYKQVFPRPKDYAILANKWTSALKKEFPDAKIAVLGVVPKPEKPPRLQNWHRDLFKGRNSTSADAVTLHLYTGHGLDNNNKSFKSYPYFKTKDVPIILGEPFREWQTMRERDAYKLIPEDRKIWLTEYNLMDKGVAGTMGQQYKVIGSWAHGLYTMAMSLVFLEEPRVEIMCNHVLIGNSRFAAILADEKSLLDPKNKNSATPLSLSATGSALQPLVDSTAGMSTAHQINFSGNVSLKGQDNFRYPALTGWVFSNDSQSKAVIVNLSGRKFNVNLNDLFKRNTSYEQVFGNPKTLVGDPQALKRKTGKIKRSIVLPSYSVTKLN